MSQRIFKSPEDEAKLEAWYDHFLARIDAPSEHLKVETSHGPNHVLSVGDKRKPVLVCLHGAMGSSAHTTSELSPLLDHFHILAPDLPGTSARGPRVRLELDGEVYANWLVEVLDGLELDQVDLCAVSWGGFVALQTAAMAPERIRNMVLIVPAGVVNGSIIKGLAKVMIPMAMYKLFPSEARLRRFVEPVMTSWDDDWAHYMGDAFQGFKIDLRPPPLSKLADLDGFEAPTLVFGAADDLSFPGQKLLERIEELIPHSRTELIDDCKHMPPTTDEFRQWLADEITGFLDPGALQPDSR
jgi:pimeloyl-ACP methyl ester carboxylesterase